MKVNLSITQAQTLAVQTLVNNKVSLANANSVANALVKAEIEGQFGHGLSRLITYAPQSSNGKVDGFATPSLTDLTPCAVRIDAAGGFAFPAMEMAIETLVPRAKEFGIAIAAIHHSHHFGQASAPCEALAKQGQLAMIFGNAPPAMPLSPATHPMIGTNPITLAAPIEGQPPLLIDMATSSVARGKIVAAQIQGESIPDHWATDENGNPTTDPAVAIKGSLQPIGGHKGALLALMVEILSACLTGSNLGFQATSLLNDQGEHPNLGHTLIAIHPAALSANRFNVLMHQLITFMTENGAKVPGNQKPSMHQNAAVQGINIDAALHQKILQLSL